MSKPRFSADDLFHGAMYATEQAGHLLHDAVALYEKGRYATPAALAVFAREELGRARIYLQASQEALTNGPVSVESVRKRCTDHIEKLQQGQKSMTLRWGAEHAEKLRGLFMDRSSPDHQKAEETKEIMQESKRRRAPRALDNLRQRALYVDPAETDSGWNRPCDISREECQRVLEEVANEYGAFSLNLLRKEASAIAAWAECPPLPDPVHPRFF